MRCYVDNRPCSCSLDEVAEHACRKDGAVRGPTTDEDIPDPFRAGEMGLDEHLFYLNGVAA